MVTSGLGTATYGTGYYGSQGFDTLIIESARQDTPNSVILNISGEIDFSPAYNLSSVLRPKNWMLLPNDARVQFVEKVNSNQIKVFFDTRLLENATYQIIFLPEFESALFSTQINPVIQADSQVTADSLFLKDIAYPAFKADIISKGLGTLQVQSGDYALHKGVASLKQRIMRRVLTGLNEIVFLQGYGINNRLKTILTSGRLQQLRTSISEQVQQEPEVIASRVELTPSNTPTGQILVVQIRIKTAGETIEFSEQLSLE